MQKKTILWGLACAGLLSAAAAPTVSGVRLEADADSPRVVVHYKLDSAAVVTVRFASGGVAVPDACTRWVGGDVNARVAATSGDDERAIYWAPDKEDWGEGGAPTFANLTVTVTAWAPDAPPDYMVADLLATNCVRYYASADAVPFGVTNAVYKTTKMVFRKIPAKDVVWKMGLVTTETASLRAFRKNRLSADYYLGIYPVTQRQSYSFCGVLNPANSSWSSDEDSPRRAISALTYALLLGDKDGFEPTAASHIGKFRALTGLRTANLPTEAQWEYACHGGNDLQGYWGYVNDQTTNAKYEWIIGTRLAAHPHEVGLLLPNAFGLYDMLGNVLELCLDYCDALPGDTTSIADDFVNTTKTQEKRVLKGGSYANDNWTSRVASYQGGGMGNAEWNYGYRLLVGIKAE